MSSTTQVIVVGSGAGGAVTALELARAGYEVTILEEGPELTDTDRARSMPEAMRLMYRNRGMTPIIGKVPVGYVEGACLGGSTEINTGFWHRTPAETLLRWKAQYDLADCLREDLAPHFSWAEERLGVTLSQKPWPPSTEVFVRGIEAMGWSYQEVPRAAPGCVQSNLCAVGCPTGAKQGMTRRLLPEARAAGAKVITNIRVNRLLKRRRRVDGVLATLRESNGHDRLVRINAEHVFVCAGATETPVLLLRSGIKYHVGSTLRIHPYLKVAARFPDALDSLSTAVPLVQVKEFWPELSLGGAFFSLGQLAMTLSENWPQTRHQMQEQHHHGMYYVGVRGSGHGWVRPTVFGRDAAVVHYQLTDRDLHNLSVGLARLAALLLAAGACEIYPSVWGLPAIRTQLEAARWLDEPLPRSGLGLVTVHAFSSCPSGHRRARCAVDSFGRVYGFDNLYIGDASMLPDSPGVNPQGSIMAMARRNVLRFVDHQRP